MNPLNAEDAAKLLKAAAADEATKESDAEEYKQRMGSELKELAAYRKALEQEFGKMDPNDPTTAEAARKVVIENVPTAGEALRHLLVHSESDSVRLSAAKFVFDHAIRQAKIDGEDDATTKWLKSMAPDNSEVTVFENEDDGA